MASGTALVAPNSGGLTSYANETNAWLVRAEANDFREAIHEAARQSPERASKILNGRLTAERYSWEKVASRFLCTCREIHAMTQGERSTTAVQPFAWSTKGNAFGRQIKT
jgi:hypothetical protein